MLLSSLPGPGGQVVSRVLVQGIPEAGQARINSKRDILLKV